MVKYGHHYLWDGAVKVNYRYYNDDWGIQGHTLEVTYDQRFDTDWIVSPQVRIYTQTGASFYGSRFAAARTLMSADYRLSPLDSVLGGLTITRKINDALGVSLGATLQSQWGRDRVTPIPTSSTAPLAASASAADMTVLAITVGFSRTF
jgi:hypothetical protein